MYIENFSIESNEEKRVKHNIENLQDFIKLNTCVLTGWGGGWGGDDFLASTRFQLRASDTELIFVNYTGDSWVLSKIYVTIEYTKTTN